MTKNPTVGVNMTQHSSTQASPKNWECVAVQLDRSTQAASPKNCQPSGRAQRDGRAGSTVSADELMG
jgi:hypothetical protein